MENTSTEEKIDYKGSVKVALKTLLFCFVLMMFISCSIFVISPKTSLKINEMFGFTKLQEINYSEIYKRSGKISDLYNAILFEQEVKNYDAELNYIDEILQKKEYQNFCSALDEASLKTIKDKNLIPYSANVNAFLLGQRVICLYNLKKSTIEVEIYNQIKNSNITETSFATYVDLICENAALSASQKSEKITDFINTFELKENVPVKLIDLIEDKIAGLNTKLGEVTDNNQKIIITYALMRNYRSKYFIYTCLNDEIKKTENYNLYNNAKIQLETLVSL